MSFKFCLQMSVSVRTPAAACEDTAAKSVIGCEPVGMLAWVMASSFFTGNIQDVILQEHIEKEDKVLVSLAGLKQVGRAVRIRNFWRRLSEK